MTRYELHAAPTTRPIIRVLEDLAPAVCADHAAGSPSPSRSRPPSWRVVPRQCSRTWAARVLAPDRPKKEAGAEDQLGDRRTTNMTTADSSATPAPRNPSHRAIAALRARVRALALRYLKDAELRWSALNMLAVLRQRGAP